MKRKSFSYSLFDHILVRTVLPMLLGVFIGEQFIVPAINKNKEQTNRRYESQQKKSTPAQKTTTQHKDIPTTNKNAKDIKDER